MQRAGSLHWATELVFSYFSTLFISSAIESDWWGEFLVAA